MQLIRIVGQRFSTSPAARLPATPDQGREEGSGAEVLDAEVLDAEVS